MQTCQRGLRGNFIVGIKSFHGNPYDGHTLSEMVDEVKKVAEDPKKIFVDLGYRGNNLKSKRVYPIDCVNFLEPCKAMGYSRDSYYSRTSAKVMNL